MEIENTINNHHIDIADVKAPQLMNTDGLKIIVGRIEPKIYAFTTETVPNYLKVGDTYRPVETRLDEWRQYFSDLVKQYEGSAMVDEKKKKYFRDFAVHWFLENERKKRRLEGGDIPGLSYYSREFFEGATKKDVEAAVSDIKASFEKNDGRYTFYEAKGQPAVYHYERTEKYEPRENQKETIERFMKAYGEGRKNLLMYAVMRFGKSFTAMCCALAMEAKRVVIVSAKADVREEWKRTVESHVKFADYEFIDSRQLRENSGIYNDGEKKKVVFLTLQDLSGEEIKEWHQPIFNSEADLLVIDETHYGVRAKKLGEVLRQEGLSDKEIRNEIHGTDTAEQYEDNKLLKKLCAKVRLHLSGTPYRILMGDEFKDDDIVAFCQYTDIVGEKEKWDKENLHKDEVEEWDNPYYGFPQMVRFAFNLNEASMKKIEELKEEGAESAFSKIFRPKSLTKDDEGYDVFVYENEVLGLLKAIDGSETDGNVFGFLDYEGIRKGMMCRHMVFVLPYKASCDAMEQLLTSHKKEFKNLGDYEIVNISGLDADKKYPSANDVKARIRDIEERDGKSITLTVNHMLTGSTVKEWDTMVYLKDTASPQEYDQSTFRIQNPYIKEYVDKEGNVIKHDMKPQTLLVDFKPDRMFCMQENKALIYNDNTDKKGNTQLEERIKEELRISPIIYVRENSLRQVKPADIMDAVREYSRNKSVMDEATDIPADMGLLSDEVLRQYLNGLNPINSKDGMEIKPVLGDGDEGEVREGNAPTDDDQEGKDNNVASDEKKEKEEKEELDKKIQAYYARILFFAFLTNDEVKSVDDVLKVIDGGDEDDDRIRRNCGLEKNFLLRFKGKLSSLIFHQLDNKIQNINSLARDESLSNDEKVRRALKKFGRMSKAEIVTPLNVAKEVLDMLPDNVTAGSKFLDIASKQGEFTIALINKYGDKVKGNIWAIPTSGLAYEFTRKVYLLLGVPVSHIFADITSYDLIYKKKKGESREGRKQRKEKINRLIDTLKDMEFNAIVGNPPYQENNEGAGSSASPIYNFFIETAKKICPPYLSIIIPARWFAGGRGVNVFRKNMLADNHINIIHDYENAEECFPNVEIKGGIMYFLWNRSYRGDCHIYSHNAGRVSQSTRPLQEKDIDVFIRHNDIISIINKVKNRHEKTFNTIVSPRDPFGYDVRKEGTMLLIKPTFDLMKKEADDVAFYYYGWRTKGVGYVRRKSIREGHDCIDIPKVFIPKVWGNGRVEDDRVKPFIPEESSVCFETYLMVGPFNTWNEAGNAKKYIETKFFHIMVSPLKISQQAMRSVYRFVPLQDFTSSSDIDWSASVADIDRQLYDKYGLTDDERAFIERMIKPVK